MYLIKKCDMFEGWGETVDQSDNPAEAYELAHKHMAEVYDSGEPFVVEITNSEGQTKDPTVGNIWKYCAKMRCPTGIEHQYRVTHE